METIEITVNNKIHVIPQGTTLGEFVTQERIPSKGTAIAINGRVVRQSDWGNRPLCHRDALVVISAAYGG